MSVDHKMLMIESASGSRYSPLSAYWSAIKNEWADGSTVFRLLLYGNGFIFQMHCFEVCVWVLVILHVMLDETVYCKFLLYVPWFSCLLLGSWDLVSLSSFGLYILWTNLKPAISVAWACLCRSQIFCSSLSGPTWNLLFIPLALGPGVAFNFWLFAPRTSFAAWKLGPGPSNHPLIVSK